MEPERGLMSYLDTLIELSSEVIEVLKFWKVDLS